MKKICQVRVHISGETCKLDYIPLSLRGAQHSWRTMRSLSRNIYPSSRARASCSRGLPSQYWHSCGSLPNGRPALNKWTFHWDWEPCVCGAFRYNIHLPAQREAPLSISEPFIEGVSLVFAGLPVLHIEISTHRQNDKVVPGLGHSETSGHGEWPSINKLDNYRPESPNPSSTVLTSTAHLSSLISMSSPASYIPLFHQYYISPFYPFFSNQPYFSPSDPFGMLPFNRRVIYSPLESILMDIDVWKWILSDISGYY